MAAVRVKILRKGYGRPVGERYRRHIMPGEVILWDGPLGDWMRDADADEEPEEERQDVPSVLRRAMERTRSSMTVREMQALGQEPAPEQEAPADAGGEAQAEATGDDDKPPARGGRGRRGSNR